MKATVGRIVHYHYEPSTPLAAIVTAVGTKEIVTLTVYGVNGSYVVPHVPFSVEPAPGHWSWTPNNR